MKEEARKVPNEEAQVVLTEGVQEVLTEKVQEVLKTRVAIIRETVSSGKRRRKNTVGNDMISCVKKLRAGSVGQGVTHPYYLALSLFL